MRSFFRYLHKTGQIATDPTANLELPKRGERLPKQVLTEDEMLQILEVVPTNTPLGLRDKAIVELVYGTGLRSLEVRRLELKDVNMGEEYLTVHGKGDRQAVIPFPKEASAALQNYLLYGRSKLLDAFSGGNPRRVVEAWPREYVFLSKNGFMMGCEALYCLVRKYAQTAGIEKRVGFHSLRHSVATHLLQRGADIRHIQALLRHKDISTTQLYTHLCVDDLREAQKKYHPRSAAGGR